MPRRTFKEATDLLRLSGRELSALLGIPPQSVKQARLDPSNRGYRSPPPGWESVLAEVARKQGKALEKLARDLKATD